jgi:hypothetical protein
MGTGPPRPTRDRRLNGSLRQGAYTRPLARGQAALPVGDIYPGFALINQSHAPTDLGLSASATW